MKAIGHGGPESGVRLELPAPTIVLEALSRFLPPETIGSVLTQTGRHSQRIRRISATATVWLVIAIGIWTDLDMPAIWRQVVGTLRSLFLVLEAKRPPSKSALSRARTRLGARVLRQLFVATSAPIALDRTRGAFYKGMRLMAIDGVHFEMPDTPANAVAFGRPGTRRNGQIVEGGSPSARGERENSGLKTPFLAVKTTGETPVPQFCHGLLSSDARHLPVGNRDP